MIVPVFKPLGKSTHQLARKLGGLQGEKATHTGTLDPMAEGVVVVLTGEDRLEKEKYADWRKTYDFQMLVGVSTDSHDLLGLAKMDFPQQEPLVDKTQLEKALKAQLENFIGKQKQLVPSFSAKRLDGGSYFDSARAGKKTPRAEEEIVIFSLELNEVTTISTAQVSSAIQEKVSLVEGDFRQGEILQTWADFFRQTQRELFYLASLQAVTSKRTYIRGLVRDLGTALKQPVTTYSITRTANGPYRIENCICLL